MKALIAALTFAMITTAAAQIIPTPRTVPFNDASGKAIGTATFWGRRMTLRDGKGDLIGTVTLDADGTKTLYDPNGKILDRITGSDNPPR